MGQPACPRGLFKAAPSARTAFLVTPHRRNEGAHRRSKLRSSVASRPKAASTLQQSTSRLRRAAERRNFRHCDVRRRLESKARHDIPNFDTLCVCIKSSVCAFCPSAPFSPGVLRAPPSIALLCCAHKRRCNESSDVAARQENKTNANNSQVKSTVLAVKLVQHLESVLEPRLFSSQKALGELFTLADPLVSPTLSRRKRAPLEHQVLYCHCFQRYLHSLLTAIAYGDCLQSAHSDLFSGICLLYDTQKNLYNSLHDDTTGPRQLSRICRTTWVLLARGP